jgi:hypothetical protein
MGEPEWTNVMILQDDFCSATIILISQSDALSKPLRNEIF